MFAAALLPHREAMGMPSYPNGIITADMMDGLVYCSDMKINFGAKEPISDNNPTGSRVSATNLLLATDMVTLRGAKLKNFADQSEATDITLYGSPTLGGQVGIRAPATHFDGSNHYATSPHATAWATAQANKTCTICAVVAWDAKVNNQYIVRKDSHFDAYLYPAFPQASTRS